MKKFIPKKTNIKAFKSALKEDNKILFTDSLIERISESGDISGSPFAHWRWKKKYFADIITYPISEEEISVILKLANKYNIPVTPRGAGICYYGSSVPTIGGVIIDLKRMNNFKIDTNSQIISVQAGTTFITLINALNDTSFELPCYPSSAISSTIGGWIGIGAKIGIGTFKNGLFINYINKMQVILPSGEKCLYNSKNDFEIFFDSYGIYGIITEIELKLIPKNIKFPFCFGFDNLENITNVLNELVQNSKINLVYFYDSNYEILCNGISNKPYYLFILLNNSNSDVQEQNKKIEKVILKNNGEVLDKEYTNKVWASILKQEIMLKAKVPVLMLQSYLLDLKYCKETIENFEELTKKRDLNHCFNGMINKDLKVRLNLFTPTDSKYIVHFLSSKAVLHRIIKNLYKNNKGIVYTYGLLNTIYLHKFEKAKKDKLIEQKQKYDPNFILNPFKLISSRARFRRINTIFAMNLFWRKMAKKIVTAKKVNLFEIKEKIK